MFHRRIAARERIADHHEIGRRFEMRGLVALHERDALRLELRAHRRIDIDNETRNAQAELALDEGDAAQEGTTETEEEDEQTALTQKQHARQLKGEVHV